MSQYVDYYHLGFKFRSVKKRSYDEGFQENNMVRGSGDVSLGTRVTKSSDSLCQFSFLRYF